MTRLILALIALLALVFGVFAALFAKSAVHEIEAGIALLIFTACLIGEAVLHGLARIEAQAKAQAEALATLAALRHFLEVKELDHAHDLGRVADGTERNNQLLEWIGEMEKARAEGLPT